MLKTYFIIAFLLLGFTLQGCATMEKLDGSTEDELAKFKMDKNQMWKELKLCRNENRALRNQVSLPKQENQRIADLEEQIRELEKENERLINEKTELEEKLFAPEVKEPEQQKDVRKLKIKVLSGDGKIGSAKQMAEKLTEMGYRVSSVALAPRSTFNQTIVYFAPAVKNEADSLATQLGSSTISKPLSWSSEFDLIVVTGKVKNP